MSFEVVAQSSDDGLTDEGLIPTPGLLSRYARLANGARAHYVTSGESEPRANASGLQGRAPSSQAPQ